MTRNFQVDAARRDREIELAIAQGRHSRTFRSLCGGCGQWVEGIFYSDRGVRLCAKCAPTDRKAGQR